MKQKQHLGVSSHPRVWGFASKNIYKTWFAGHFHCNKKYESENGKVFYILFDDVMGVG